MEAKDTVMDIAEDKYDGLGADTLVEIQAEVSFKAGQDSELEGRAEWGKLMYRAGIREVVEWIEGKLRKVTGNLVKPYRFINEDEWQAFKKEWGL